MKPASYLRRILAIVIDFEVFALGVLVILLALSQTLSAVSSALNFLLLSGSLIVFWYLFYIIANSWLVAKKGGSVGKIFSGIEIGRDGLDKRITTKRAIFRTVIGGAIASSFFFVGYLWIFYDKKRRGWHDLASQTEVFDRKDKAVIALPIIIAIVLLALKMVVLFNLAMSFDPYVRNLNKEYPEIFEEMTPSDYENQEDFSGWEDNMSLKNY